MLKPVIYLFTVLIIISPLALPSLSTWTPLVKSSSANSVGIANWSVVEQVMYTTKPAEVYSGIDVVGNGLVVGVGTDQSSHPFTTCLFAYGLGDSALRYSSCKPFDGVGLYDVYSPWRNGSALMVGWRDPGSMKNSGVFVYQFDYPYRSLKMIVTYDDPDHDDETMTSVIGYGDYIITAGKVTGIDRITMIYVFKKMGGEYRFYNNIPNAGDIIFRHDINGEPAIYSALVVNGNTEIYRIDPGGGASIVDTIRGDIPTVFRSTLMVGNDVLGVTDRGNGTISLWTPETGVFYTYHYNHGFNSVSRRASHYGDNYALIYGYNNKQSYTGPIYATDLNHYDSRIGRNDWRLKWSSYAPILLTRGYAIVSAAKGLGDSVISIYNVKTTPQQEPTSTTTTTHESTVTSQSTTPTPSPTTSTQSQPNTSSESSTTTKGQETASTNGHGEANNGSGSGVGLIVAVALIAAIFGALASYIIFRRR